MFKLGFKNEELIKVILTHTHTKADTQTQLRKRLGVR